MMKSQESITYYDHHAARLNLDWERSKNPGELVPFLSELKPNSRVLDLGCGNGMDLMWMIRSGHVVVGVDASPRMVELARQRNPLAEVLQKNYLMLSLKDGEWDGVWSNVAFAHLTPEETQRVAAVCFKGLKPGGVLGLVVYEGTGTFEDRTGDVAGPSRHIHLFTETQLCSMLEQTGFTIKKIGRQASAGDQSFESKILVIATRV